MRAQRKLVTLTFTFSTLVDAETLNEAENVMIAALEDVAHAMDINVGLEVATGETARDLRRLLGCIALMLEPGVDTYGLRHIQSKLAWTAPEAMGQRWAEAEAWLEERVTPHHPLYTQVRDLWNGAEP